ncbi:MAG: hypothetical protein P8X55_19555 [Desulfosarcinaceae bacterium]
MGSLFKKIMRRTKAIAGKVEQAQEAITFAQAGHPQLGDSQRISEPVVSGKLLVVGQESLFSQTVMDYALEMAARMSYEIVALNTAPLSCNAFKPFAASQKKICQEFQDLSMEHAQGFKQAAAEQGIPFTHVVKFSEPEKALEMVQREFSPIDFVISDEQHETNENRITDTERPRNQIYVYSMI